MPIETNGNLQLILVSFDQIFQASVTICTPSDVLKVVWDGIEGWPKIIAAFSEDGTATTVLVFALRVSRSYDYVASQNLLLSLEELQK